jgi:hypothetical protein
LKIETSTFNDDDEGGGATATAHAPDNDDDDGDDGDTRQIKAGDQDGETMTLFCLKDFRR